MDSNKPKMVTATPITATTTAGSSHGRRLELVLLGAAVAVAWACVSGLIDGVSEVMG